MEPTVRYATSADGVRIAYTVTGEGPPVVAWNETLSSHVQLEWSQPTLATRYRRIAARNTLIRFDVRGAGLSERVFAQPDQVPLDLLAVVDALRLERFALIAMGVATLGAIDFIYQHPLRVSRFVTIDGYLRADDLARTPQASALLAAARADFVLATEAIGTAAFGPSRSESRDYGDYIRSCIGPEYFEMLATFPRRDVSQKARWISLPTLVLKHADVQYVTIEMCSEVAATIAGAQLAIVRGAWADDREEAIIRAVAFVNDDVETLGSRADGSPSAVRAILFTDIVGHTDMMQRLGDAKGRDVLREHERITRETLKTHGGAEVKTMGDGFMASFGSVTSAMECAIALQRAFAAHTDSMPEPLHVRVGLNAGEPIEEDGDLFGSTVILASRIAAKAGAGEILAPEAVRGLLSGKGFVYADRGEFRLKGFEDAMRLYEVRWQE